MVAYHQHPNAQRDDSMPALGGQIDTVMQEKRLFPPPKKFAGVAHSLDRAPSPRRMIHADLIVADPLGREKSMSMTHPWPYAHRRAPTCCHPTLRINGHATGGDAL